MGKERGKKGKQFFLHITCLLAILLLSAGCATPLNLQKIWQGRKHLNMSEKLMRGGDFNRALEEYEKVVMLFPSTSPGDRALFNMGIIWAHPDNPQKNYQKALECFQRLVRDFPRSDLMGEVMLWTGTINKLILYEGEIRDLTKTANGLKNQLNTLKKINTEIDEKNKNLEEAVSSLKKQFNAFKEIDIGIDEKKRGDLPRK